MTDLIDFTLHSLPLAFMLLWLSNCWADKELWNKRSHVMDTLKVLLILANLYAAEWWLVRLTGVAH